VKRRTTTAAIVLLMAQTVGAQEDSGGSDRARFTYRVGAQLFSDFTSHLRVDSETLGRGTEIVLEDDLSVEDSLQILRFDGTYRFNERHAVNASIYNIKRRGGNTLSKEIQFGDQVFSIDTEVESTFRQGILKLVYSYRFLDRPNLDLGATIGVHTMKLRSDIVATDGSRAETRKTDAPLPVIGIQGSYRFSPKWRLVGSTEWFDIKSGDAQGTFLDALFSVEYDISDHYGIGFGFNRFELDVISGDEKLKGAVFLKFDAALLYFKGGFGGR
jgi:hypothetical protein